MLSNIIGKNLYLGNKKIKTEEIKSKYICLYFSASWCAPCKKFSPKLIDYYKKYKKEKDFEIILIPYKEINKEDYKKYYNLMPWYSTTRIKNYVKLKELYKCNSVPYLIVLNKKGQIISNNGRYDLLNDENGNLFPWKLTKEFKNINYSLYEDKHPKETMKDLGYIDEDKALQTLNKIKNKSKNYQISVVNTMKNRAKYHPNKTKKMNNAIKVFDTWLKKRKYTYL